MARSAEYTTESLLAMLNEYPELASADTIDKQTIDRYAEITGVSNLYYHIRKLLPKVSRGVFALSEDAIEQAAPAQPKTGNVAAMSNVVVQLPTNTEQTAVSKAVAADQEITGTVFSKHAFTVSEPVVPAIDKNFVPFGCFSILNKVIKTGKFAPIYIVGDSGNGKTFSVKQSCARNNRKYEYISIEENTGYNELIATVQLVDGSTEIHLGAATRAMKAGAVLLLDEIDRGTSRNLMCLQSILNGDPVTIKETGEVIYPAEGFTVIATGNTKGRGDDSGRFSAAEVIDEATLERFPITLEQSYPTQTIEKRILSKVFKGQASDEYIMRLVKFAHTTRKLYDEDDGEMENFITTRRLVHIANNFLSLEDEDLAVELGINRFDSEVRDAMMNLYSALKTEEEQERGG